MSIHQEFSLVPEQASSIENPNGNFTKVVLAGVEAHVAPYVTDKTAPTPAITTTGVLT